MIRNRLFVILFLLCLLNTAEAREPVTKEVILDHADLTMTIPTNLDNQVILDFPEIPAFVSIGSDDFRVFTSKDTNIVVLKPNKPTESNLFVKLKDYNIVVRLDVRDTVNDFIDKYKFVYPSQTLKAIVASEVNKKVEGFEKDYTDKLLKLNEIADVKAQEIITSDILRVSETRKLLISDRKGQVRLKTETISKLGSRSFLKFKIENMSKRDYKIYKIVLVLEERQGIIFKTITKSTEVKAVYTFSNDELIIKKGRDFFGVVSFNFNEIFRDKGERLTLYVNEADGDRDLKISLLKL